MIDILDPAALHPFYQSLAPLFTGQTIDPGPLIIHQKIWGVFENWFIDKLQVIAEFIFGIVTGLFSFVAHLIIGTPHPETSSGAIAFGQPSDPIWSEIYNQYQSRVVPAAVLILGVQLAFVMFFGSLTSFISSYRREQLLQRFVLAVFGVLAWWVIAVAALTFFNELALYIAPDPGQINTMSENLFQSVTVGGLSLAALIISAYVFFGLGTPIILSVILVYMIRAFLIYVFVYGMPYLIALWPVNVSFMKPISNEAEDLMEMFPPLLFMTLPNAIMLRVAFIMFSATASLLDPSGGTALGVDVPEKNNMHVESGSGGVDAGAVRDLAMIILNLAIALIIPLVALFIPRYLLYSKMFSGRAPKVRTGRNVRGSGSGGGGGGGSGAAKAGVGAAGATAAATTANRRGTSTTDQSNQTTDRSNSNTDTTDQSNQTTDGSSARWGPFSAGERGDRPTDRDVGGADDVQVSVGGAAFSQNRAHNRLNDIQQKAERGGMAAQEKSEVAKEKATSFKEMVTRQVGTSSSESTSETTDAPEAGAIGPSSGGSEGSPALGSGSGDQSPPALDGETTSDSDVPATGTAESDLTETGAIGSSGGDTGGSSSGGSSRELEGQTAVDVESEVSDAPDDANAREPDAIHDPQSSAGTGADSGSATDDSDTITLDESQYEVQDEGDSGENNSGS